MYRKHLVLSSAICMIALVGLADAAPITITNSSFESPDVTGSDSTDPAGWTSVGHPNYIRTMDAPTWLDGSGNQHFSTPYGDQAMTAYHSGGSHAYQDVGTVAADTTYTLTFNVSAGDQPVGEYRADLVAIDGGGNETVLGFVAGDVNTDDMSFSDTVIASPTTNIGETLRIKLWQDPNRGNYRNKPVFDNVALDAVIPEPGSLALLGLGGLMMIKRRRRG